MSETDRLRAQFEAATYLFEMTGEAQFKQFADANFEELLPPWGPSMWEVDALDSLLYYARLPGATPEVAKSIRERFLANLSRASQAFQSSLAQADPYRAPMKDYTWGSNKGKTMQARLFQLVALHSADPGLSDDFAGRRIGIRPLCPWRESAWPRLSDEHGPWPAPVTQRRPCFIRGLPGYALATSDRSAPGSTARFPGGRTQSAVLDRFMLQRAARIARLPLLRSTDVCVVPAQFQAAVGTASSQVVSSVQ